MAQLGTEHSPKSRTDFLKVLATACVVASMLAGVWSAFQVEHPEGPILAVALYAVGLVWLWWRAGRAPAIYLVVIFSLELLLELTIFGAIGLLRNEEGWGNFANALATLLADVLGLTACILLVRAEHKVETPPDVARF
jgi:hypothetical protein